MHARSARAHIKDLRCSVIFDIGAFPEPGARIGNKRDATALMLPEYF